MAVETAEDLPEVTEIVQVVMVVHKRVDINLDLAMVLAEAAYMAEIKEVKEPAEAAEAE